MARLALPGLRGYVAVMGAFVTFTAILILIPLYAEIRSADRDLRELMSPSLLAFGLLIAGLGLWLAPDHREATVAGFGIALACAGLLLRPSGLPPVPAPTETLDIVREGSSP